MRDSEDWNDPYTWVMKPQRKPKKMKHERPPFSRRLRETFSERPDLLRRLLAKETVEDYTQAETALLDLVLTGNRRFSRSLRAEVIEQLRKQFLEEDPAVLLRTLA